MTQKAPVGEIFGSFHLSDSEFAIPAKHVQEVVNPPESYSSLPLSPDYLLGLFNLRGAIIPVVDLARLLKLQASRPSEGRRIAILELDGHCVGLLFDQTGEVFRSNEEERSDFDDPSKSSVIEGVFKKEQGKRIIQILNVSSLFNLKSLPLASEQSHRIRAIANRRGARKQCISFVVGSARCALEISDVHEILKFTQLAATALANGNCIGAIDLRGATIPIIDFASLLKYRDVLTQEQLVGSDRRIIVLRMNDELFGLLVESVDSIITFYEDDLRSFPVLTSDRKKMFSGCLSMSGVPDTLVLDAKNIFTDQETLEITRGHSRIYKVAESAKASYGREERARRTFITFSINASYAIPIGDVREIIHLPDSLIKPPGLPPACCGVLNLRGEMVLIADGRRLYGQEPKAADGDQRVLIFKHEGCAFGVVVDSVEAIRSFSDQDKVALPDSLYKSGGKIQDDIAEAVMLRDSDGRETPLLILGVASISDRVQKSDSVERTSA